MQVERAVSGFQICENKAESHAAEPPAIVGHVPSEDTVPESGSDVVVAYQPRIASTSVSASSANANGAPRVGSPTPPSALQPQQPEPAAKKRSPISLVADKYMILDELEGSSLNMCINIHTQEEFVCKVR